MKYKYKKVKIDLSKIQGCADGAVLLRVNCLVADSEIYNVLIPKKFDNKDF